MTVPVAVVWAVWSQVLRSAVDGRGQGTEPGRLGQRGGLRCGVRRGDSTLQRSLITGQGTVAESLYIIRQVRA